MEQLTGFVLVQEGIARAGEEPGLFDPYIGQVALVRSLYDRGDRKGSCDLGVLLMMSPRRRCITLSVTSSGGTKP